MLDNNAAAIDIAADSSNNLYELHKTGGLYHYTGTACTGASCPGWKEYDNNSWTGRIAASNGILYQLHVNQASLALALTCYDCR